MKKIILISVSFFLLSNLYGKDDCFILIDVSGNPTKVSSDNRIADNIRKQAINILGSLLRRSIDSTKYPAWNFKNPGGILLKSLNQTGGSILNSKDMLGIIPYGERDTYKSFRLFNSNDVNVKISNAIKFAHKLEYNDQLTFGQLARAKAADIALETDVKTYYFIEIKGFPDDTDSRMSDQEKKLLDQYNRRVISKPIGVIAHQFSPLRILIKKINIKKTEDVTNHNFRMLSPDGTKNEPENISAGNDVQVSWAVVAAPDTTKYTVTANDVHSDEKIVQSCEDCKKLSLALEPGLYSIHLKATGLPECRNNNTYVKVKSNGGGGFFIFLLILGIIVGGIVYLIKYDPFGLWQENKESNNNTNEIDINV